jgi:hypothetical protein
MLGDSKEIIRRILLDNLAVQEFTKFIRETELFLNSHGDDITFSFCSVDGQEYSSNSDGMLLSEWSSLMNAVVYLNENDESSLNSEKILRTVY